MVTHDLENRLKLCWSLADCESRAWLTVWDRIIDLSYSIVVASNESLFVAQSVPNQARFCFGSCWTRKYVEIVNVMFENMYYDRNSVSSPTPSQLMGYSHFYFSRLSKSNRKHKRHINEWRGNVMHGFFVCMRKSKR